MNANCEVDAEGEASTAAGERSTGPGTTAASLHEEILDRLRGLIVEGQLEPGSRVPERQLCELLRISRTPLREALKVLAAEGLIQLLPNRGARVRRVGRDDLRHLFEVMAGLEALAGHLACERISDAGIAEIERLHYEMYTCYIRRDLPGYFRFNQMIHDRIVEAADNPLLLSTYSSLAGRIRPARYAANTLKRDRWGDAMREHEAILDALRHRDAAGLGETLFRHLQLKCQAALEQLPAEQSGSGNTPGDSA